MSRYLHFIQHSSATYNKYQEEAVEWCLQREDQDAPHTRGGILADDMGLGKTVTMIATIICNFQRPTLIVVPPILLEQWSNQFETFIDYKPFIYYGNNKTHSCEYIASQPVVLTTYNTLAQDLKTNQKLYKIEWFRVICDEAHNLRNNKTNNHRAVAAHTYRVMWLVTGTPIHNRLNDLFSLLDLLKLNRPDFTKKTLLIPLLNMILLRRTKKDASLSLPELSIVETNVSWKNEMEKKISEEIHSCLDFTYLKSKGIDPNYKLACFTYAKQSCVNPTMLNSKVEKLKDLGIIDINMKIELEHMAMTKLMIVADSIDKGNRDDKKIVFCTYHEEIDTMKKILINRGYDVGTIDGRTTKNERAKLLENSPTVLILQIKTGNEGLNLQTYNKMYFVTCEWNPKIEEQAIARCYRMGQTKEVTVERFIMNSFDIKEQTKNIEQYIQTKQKIKCIIANDTINSQQ
jgi:SNF2 family DNA or RNA helicase